MKNYLVSAVRPIRNGWMDNIHSTELYKDYRIMYNLSLASYRKFVVEPFEAILWEEPAVDNEEYTKLNWQAIKELWHREPCNIFWAGADTLMTKPTELFSDRFTEYRLFNYTDPRTWEGKPYYNNDLQYFPSTMKQQLWQLGDDLWKDCDTHPARNWGFDQIRNNTMFWSQNVPDPHHPEMAYQAMDMRSFDPNVIAWHDHWNQIFLNQAHILHFAASRGSRQVISIMKEFCNKLEIAI
jgi:hypothetical protein